MSPLLALLALIFALPAFGRSKNDDVAAIQMAIESGNRAYVAALEAQDAQAFADLFVDDAVSLPPNGPLIRGKLAIASSMSSAFVRVKFIDASMHTTEMRMMGDTAVELGTYHLVTQVDGYPTILNGRYLTVWRRDGAAWKIAVDSSQPDAIVPNSHSSDAPVTSTQSPQANE